MALTASIELTNAVGLHARPSVKLTQLAKTFSASVELAIDPEGPWNDAKSPVKVMRVKAPKGAMLYFRAEGSDEEAALQAMVELVAARFGEE
jgi:phosphocarrier protein HPr